MPSNGSTRQVTLLQQQGRLAAWGETCDANGTASDLTGCNEELPLLGVTREFDFGQFIELFDSSPDPTNPNVPVVSRIVIQPSATLAADRSAAKSSQPLLSSPLTGVPENGARPSSDQEVSLFTLTEQGPGAKLHPQRVEVSDVDKFFGDGTITA